MPKNVRDKGGISEEYFAGMPRGTMKNWGDPGKAISDFFHPKAKAQKPQAMNRKQVSQSASSMGYDVTPDGRFVKKGSGKMKKSAPKKQAKKPAAKPKGRNYTNPPPKKVKMSAADMKAYRNEKAATEKYNKQSNATNEKNAKYAVSSYEAAMKKMKKQGKKK